MIVDLGRQRLAALEPSTGNLLQAVDFPSPVGCVGLRAEGGYLVATARHLLLIDSNLAVEKELAGLPNGWRFNDGKVSPAGDMWLGVTQIDYQANEGWLEVLSSVDLTRTTIVEGLTLPNGLAWADECFYHVDSIAGSITRYPADDVRSGRGTAFVKDFPDGLPDGACTDLEGSLWIAVWGGGEVRQYGPSGDLRHVVNVEAKFVSSCALGGPDLRTLYITTAQDPDGSKAGGGIYTVRVATPGRPTFEFAG